jgi:tol-pal system protein YbgF
MPTATRIGGASAFLLLAMLVASPQRAFAQRASSLGDRVTALEQRAAGTQGGTELVNQISQLRAEIQELRGQVEQLQQQLEQSKQGQRSQYLDLDGRLNRLEGGTAPTPAPPVATTTAPAASAPVPSVAAPMPAPAPASMAGMDERGAYTSAFDALKSGDYVESSRRFRDFLAAFPSGQYAPNALYWLGEGYYVTQNYALAGQQFQALLDRYPNHDKAAGALLKLGLAQYGLKDYAGADATLNQVVQRYPGSDVARTADDRLRAMQIAGNR